MLWPHSDTNFVSPRKTPSKMSVVRDLLAQHPDDQVLIIGMYVEQLQELAQALGITLLTGTTGRSAVTPYSNNSGQGRSISSVQNRPMLPWICLMPPWRSRFLAPLAHGRKRPSVWGASYGPRPGRIRRTFTPLCRRIPWSRFCFETTTVFMEQGYQYTIHDVE